MSHFLKSGTKVNWIDKHGVIACGIVVEDGGAGSVRPKESRRIVVNLERINAKRPDIAHIKTGKHNIPRKSLRDGEYEIEAAT